MDEFEVLYYERPNGMIPLSIFLDELSVEMRAKAMREIELLCIYGYELREPHSKLLSDGIFELRCQNDGNITRVLYFFMSGRKVILTNGFIKKTQKTPSSVIALAKKYRRDHLSKQKK